MNRVHYINLIIFCYVCLNSDCLSVRHSHIQGDASYQGQSDSSLMRLLLSQGDHDTKGRIEYEHGSKESIAFLEKRNGKWILKPSQKNIKIIQKTPDQKGRPFITRVQANVLTRENFIQKGQKVTRIRLTGQANIYHKNIQIQAPRITIDNGEVAWLSGGIRIYDRKAKLTLYAKKALYQRQRQTIQLNGQPYLRSLNSKKITQMSCDSIEHFLDEGRSELKGRLHAVNGDIQIFGSDGSYHSKNHQLIVRGKPYAFSRYHYAASKKFVYNTKEQWLKLDGDVVFHWHRQQGAQSLIQPRRTSKAIRINLETYVRNRGQIAEHIAEANSPPNQVQQLSSQKKPRELTIITAKELYYQIPSRIEAKGKVLVTQKDAYLKTERLQLSGEDLQDIDAHQGVEIVDKKRNMKASAVQMQYRASKQKLRLTKQAELVFYAKDDKSNQEPTILRGGFIERDFAKKISRAENQVTLIQNRQRAVAELATYHENAKVLILEGNPGLFREGSFIQAEKILVFPEKDRILFQNRIQGAL